jgi:hypothetical protein
LTAWTSFERLFEDQPFGTFVLVTIFLGGGAAFLAGRAIAATWRPWWHIGFYMAALALAVRFLHYALFDSRFLSPHYYLLDYMVCLAFALLGFRLMRVRQMVTRYRWMHEPAGRLRWRRREAAAVEERPN